MNALNRSIYIVDDHPMFRRGLRESIEAEAGLLVCGESAGDNSVVADVLKAAPDLVILDITLRDRSGLDVLKALLDAKPEQQVLVISMHEEALYAERALRAGARGYIMKHEEPTKIIKCIRQILSGQVYLSETASSAIIENLTGRTIKGSLYNVDALSEREFEVFELLGQGRTTNEIATRLGLNVRTVVVHCSNIRRKLNLKHGPELVAYAARWKQSDGADKPR